MDLPDIRKLTLEGLRIFNEYVDDSHNGHEWKTLSNLKQKIQEIMHQRNQGEGQNAITASNQIPYRYMTKNEEKYFLEAFHELLNQGIIMWGMAGEPDLYHKRFSVTSYGKKALTEGQVISHDIDNYLENFRNKVPKLHELAFVYLKESVQCFINRNFIASSILLGVSSEVVFYDLFDTFRTSNLVNSNIKNKCQDLEKKSVLRKNLML